MTTSLLSNFTLYVQTNFKDRHEERKCISINRSRTYNFPQFVLYGMTFDELGEIADNLNVIPIVKRFMQDKYSENHVLYVSFCEGYNEIHMSGNGKFAIRMLENSVRFFTFGSDQGVTEHVERYAKFFSKESTVSYSNGIIDVVFNTTSKNLKQTVMNVNGFIGFNIRNRNIFVEYIQACAGLRQDGYTPISISIYSDTSFNYVGSKNLNF